MEKETKPHVYEPFRANRFILRFPDNFEIPDWFVRTCTLPVNKHNGNITVTVMCPVLLDTDKERPYNCIEHFDMGIELLSPNGSVMGCYKLVDCKINEVNNTVLNYNDDNIIGSTINISYKVCTTESLYEPFKVLFITDKN
jgi:hypothetical protein